MSCDIPEIPPQTSNLNSIISTEELDVLPSFNRISGISSISINPDEDESNEDGQDRGDDEDQEDQEDQEDDDYDPANDQEHCRTRKSYFHN